MPCTGDPLLPVMRPRAWACAFDQWRGATPQCCGELVAPRLGNLGQHDIGPAAGAMDWMLASSLAAVMVAPAEGRRHVVGHQPAFRVDVVEVGGATREQARHVIKGQPRLAVALVRSQPCQAISLPALLVGVMPKQRCCVDNLLGHVLATVLASKAAQFVQRVLEPPASAQHHAHIRMTAQQLPQQRGTGKVLAAVAVGMQHAVEVDEEDHVGPGSRSIRMTRNGSPVVSSSGSSRY
jgi:hypothetical protein